MDNENKFDIFAMEGKKAGEAYANFVSSFSGTALPKIKKETILIQELQVYNAAIASFIEFYKHNLELEFDTYSITLEAETDDCEPEE